MSIPPPVEPPFLDEEHDPPEIERAQPWLLSMADVTALMLTFFVMLFAMSHVPSEKWDEVISLINTRLDPARVEKPKPVSDLNVPTVATLTGLSTDYLVRVYGELFAGDPVLRTVRIAMVEDKLVIALPNRLLFLPGQDELVGGAPDALLRLAGVLSRIGNQVEVVGHTDPSPPADGPYPTNWELSVARAVTVANALNDAGYGGSLIALGVGDSRFRHLDPTIPEERRYEMARRVDIVIRTDAGGQ